MDKMRPLDVNIETVGSVDGNKQDIRQTETTLIRVTVANRSTDDYIADTNIEKAYYFEVKRQNGERVAPLDVHPVSHASNLVSGGKTFVEEIPISQFFSMAAGEVYFVRVAWRCGMTTSDETLVVWSNEIRVVAH